MQIPAHLEAEKLCEGRPCIEWRGLLCIKTLPRFLLLLSWSGEWMGSGEWGRNMPVRRKLWCYLGVMLWNQWSNDRSLQRHLLDLDKARLPPPPPCHRSCEIATRLETAIIIFQMGSVCKNVCALNKKNILTSDKATLSYRPIFHE